MRMIHLTAVLVFTPLFALAQASGGTDQEVIQGTWKWTSGDAVAAVDTPSPILKFNDTKALVLNTAGDTEKTGRFEVIVGDRERLNQMLRMQTFSAEDRLPQDFLQKVRDEFGCDAVMFSVLTHYRPYPPLAVGWKLRLVDAVDGQTWWTVDEVFDATDDRVAVGARKFQEKNMKYNGAIPVLQDTFTVLLVPRQFGMYTVRAVVETMPVR